MDALIDPNAEPETQDFVSQTAAVLRQRKIAEALRKQQQAYEGNQGQMMSGRYVRAPLLGHVSSALKRMGATRAENEADVTERGYNQNIDTAKRKWASSLPKAMEQQTKPFMAPGINGDENIPGTETITQKALPLTMERITQHAIKGGMIPGNKEMAELYNRNSVADLTREDQQAEKANAAELKRTFDREQEIKKHADRLEELKIKMSGQVTPEQKMAMFQQADASKRAIAKMQADAKIEAAEKAAKAKGISTKPVPVNLKKSLDDDEEIAESVMRSYTTYKPSYGGMKGMYDKYRGMLPGADPAQHEATAWWNMYEQGGLKARHDIFGATLAGKEGKSWADATIREGQSAETIMQHLKTRSEIAARHFNKSRQRAVELGYPQIQAAYDELPETATTDIPQQNPIQLTPPTQQLRPVPPQGQPRPQALPQAAPQQMPTGPGGKPLGPLATQLGVTRG